MGYAKGRFVIETHVHAQRHAFKFKEKGIKPDYATLAQGMPDSVIYDNSPRLLFDMELYGVDMCVLMCGFGMTDELNEEIVKNHPDKFVAVCSATSYMHKVRRGEVEWSIKDACKELDRQLSTGMFRGIGEFMPRNPKPSKPYTWEERFEEICQIMEVARKHKVTVGFHTGTLSGYAGAPRSPGGAFNELHYPLLAHDVAGAYPDVTIIMEHGGHSGGWSEWGFEPTLQASIPQQWTPGLQPSSYADQSKKDGPPAHQVDVWGWSLKQLDKLDILQDDMNLILGGNAARIFKLEDKLPHTRLFKQYLK
jgi:predicted TIM-barrel fold metal-dependent hydrolase